MINGNNTMFGQLEGRSFKASMMVPLMAMALSSAALGQSWELERERGVGGGGPAKTVNKTLTEQPVAKQTATKAPSNQRTIIEIIIEPNNRPVIRPAEGRPVEQAGEARSTLSTAADRLVGTPQKAIKTEALSALTRPEAAPRPAARPHEAPVEQAQFAPNAAAQPKGILPPRAGEGRSEQAFAPVITPSPRRPAALQNVLLAPNVGASAKEPVLRTAPTPDNALVELVETPSDYSLSIAAGTGQVLNVGKPIANVFVADPNVADVNVLSPTQIVVHGNQLGRTNIFGLGDGGDVILAIDVDTVPNVEVANAKLKAAAPAAKTGVSLESGTLIAAGKVNDVGEAIEVAKVTAGLRETEGPTVNNTTIEGSQQVNIRVRFAEVSRNDVFNLGINWDALVDTGDFLFGLSTGNFLAAGSDLLARDVAIVGEEFGRLDFNGQFGDVSIDAFIDALQREGIVNVLAEPNLTSVNGEPANFLAGGEIPILVPGGGGGDTVTIDYKPFGVSLDFIPTLLPGERINLRVRPEVSSISNNGAVVLDGFSVPAFTVRRAETSVELASGQTFAIAGLFQRDLTTDTDKFPVLGDVPVLGQLFRSQRFRRSETELVILITPFLVKPVSKRNVVLPNDRLGGPEKPLTRQDRKRAGYIVN